MDPPLSDAGLLQARRLTIALRAAPLRAVYSSPLRRAVQTAQAVAGAHRLEVSLVPALREISFGVWEGLTNEELEERFGDLLRTFWTAPAEARIPGGEMLADAQARVMAALTSVVERHPDETAAIVGHGGINKIALLNLLGAPLSSYWRIRQDNACINVLEVGGGHTILHILNETTHLR